MKRHYESLNEGARPDSMRSSFTRRQTEILSLIAKGYSDKEVARILDMSTKTVSVHLQRVFDKLNVRTRAAAVARWIIESEALETSRSDTAAGSDGRDARPDAWSTEWSR